MKVTVNIEFINDEFSLVTKLLDTSDVLKDELAYAYLTDAVFQMARQIQRKTPQVLDSFLEIVKEKELLAEILLEQLLTTEEESKIPDWI